MRRRSPPNGSPRCAAPRRTDEPAAAAPCRPGLPGVRFRLLSVDAGARHHRHPGAAAESGIRAAGKRPGPAGRRLLSGLCPDAVAHGELARPPRAAARDPVLPVGRRARVRAVFRGDAVLVAAGGTGAHRCRRQRLPDGALHRLPALAGAGTAAAQQFVDADGRFDRTDRRHAAGALAGTAGRLAPAVLDAGGRRAPGDGRHRLDGAACSGRRPMPAQRDITRRRLCGRVAPPGIPPAGADRLLQLRRLHRHADAVDRALAHPRGRPLAARGGAGAVLDQRHPALRLLGCGAWSRPGWWRAASSRPD